MDVLEVVEYTEPWCAWAWGSEPKLRLLRWRYGPRLVWRQVMADLLPHPDVDGSNPADTEGAVAQVKAYWEYVSGHTGMPWPDGLRRVPVSSDAACRAVIAARLRDADLADRLLRMLRESLFVFGAPADTTERVIALAETAPGIDAVQLAADLDSAAVARAQHADRAEAHRPNDYVRALAETHAGNGNARPAGTGSWRYATPTLIFRGPKAEITVPGWQPWERYEQAMETALPGSTATPRPRPSVDEALQTWPLLTNRELEALCGPCGPPPTTVEVVVVGGGHAWMSQDPPADDRT
jgi:predicted DsbA family dithiol-disulfide isomerase